MSDIHGVIGFYKDPNDILDAVKKIRERGFTDMDTFSPFPIHGMDQAIGLGRSWMPWVTFIMGLTGACAALFFQSWTMGALEGIIPRGWPLLVGGKPMFSLPAFIPITFEWTVLFGGHSTALAMIVANGLPNLKNPILNSKYANRVTSDEFAVVIFSKDPKFKESECINLLASLGAKDVQVVREDD